MSTSLPVGVVTIVFTDVEGSTALWERLGDACRPVLKQHDEIVRAAVAGAGGTEVKHEGDGFMLAFERPSAAVAFAMQAQADLAAHQWPAEVGQLLVRMGMHAGEPIPTADPEGRPDYAGPVVNRAARIADAGHGGQVLLSSAAFNLVRTDLPEGASARSLGLHRLRGLEQPEEIYELTYPATPRETFPALRTLDQHPHNLPVQLTSFVGREEELSELLVMLGDATIRLVTLLGPGGVGKTRLALQAAAESVARFGDGVWLVELAEVRQAERVAEEIATTLGIAAGAPRGPASQVCEHLAGREALLVLDNFEQVAAAAPLVGDMLRAAPQAKCLVTSRTTLRIAGEKVFDVPPMPVPQAGAPPEQMARCDSVTLLSERAATHRAELPLTDENAAAVAELCARLEGIPLAIELAASRLRSMTVQEVLQRLTRRFEFLASRHLDLPPRQRALRAAIEWSYDLLSPELRSLLAQLSAFSGGFFMDAAEAICESPDIFEDVLDLCDNSLLSSTETAGRTRYYMLESIADFAATHLGDEEAAMIQERHAQHFLALALARANQASGPEEAAAFADLEADLDNLRAGMDWAESNGNDRMTAEYADALAPFLWRRGHWQEQLDRVQAGLAAAERLEPPDLPLLGRLLYNHAAAAQDRGDAEAAAQICERGLAIAQRSADVESQAMFSNLLALALRSRGQLEEAREHLEESLGLLRDIGHSRGEGMTLHNLGLLVQGAGDRQTAQQFYQQALPLRRQVGDERGAAETVNNLGVLAEQEGRLDEAGALYRDALGSYLRLQDALGIAVSTCNLGEIAEKTGDLTLAAELLAPAQKALSELGSVYADHAAQCLERVRAALPEAPSSQPLPWRQALLAAAERAVEEVSQ